MVLAGAYASHQCCVLELFSFCQAETLMERLCTQPPVPQQARGQRSVCLSSGVVPALDAHAASVSGWVFTQRAGRDLSMAVR